MFSAAQPLYIAAPVIEGGPDPIPRRSGWREGLEDAVVLPQLMQHQPRASAPGGGPRLGAGDVADALAMLGDGPGLEGFHVPLRTATMRYAIRCTRYGARDDTAFFKKLKRAIDGAPRDLAKRPDVSNYKDDGYLGRLTDGAFALLAGDEDSQAIAPHFSAPTLTAEDGRAELGCVLDGFFDRAARWHGADRECRCDPEHAAIAVDLGLGKSRFARVRLGYFIEHAKTEGRPHRILWMVPIHRLGNESAADMRDLGLNVAVLRGRDAADPSAPGLTMCVNLTAVADAQAIGESVETAVCGTLAGACCPFHATCAYQAQKPRAVAAEVVILANQGLFNAMNKTMRANLALTIIDEAFWQTGLAHYTIRLPGFAAEPTTWPVLRDANAQREGFTMDGVRMSRRRRRKAGDLPPRWVADEDSTAELHDICRKAQAALEAIPDQGMLTRAALMRAMLTAEDCARARQLEWRRKRANTMHPGMTAEARKKARKQAEGNASIPARVALWTSLETLLKSDNELRVFAARSRRGSSVG